MTILKKRPARQKTEYNRQMLLGGKRVLVVGVRNRRSLAFAIAQQAHNAGAKLAFAVQPGDKAHDKTSAIINAEFAGCPVFPCDAAKDDDIQSATDNAAEKLGGLDGLVHAIAFARRESIMGDYQDGTDRPAFAEALDISAYTLTGFCRAAQRHFVRSGGGSVITLSYLGANRALPNYNVMGVAKAALEASVRYLAYGMGKYNVRINAVSAGPVKTLAAAGIGDFGKILAEVKRQAPLRRNINAEEAANVAVFLLSDLATAVTGEVIHADCGFHITAGLAADDSATDN
ncbi:MAG: enoyl-ACP reductase FabI [Gammaproteobacteria bacterium]